MEADDPRKLRALRALVAADDRAAAAEGPDAPPSICAFVTRRTERVGELRLDRPALVIVVEGAKEVVRAGRAAWLRSGDALALPVGWRGTVVNEPDPTSGAYRALFVGFPADLVLRAHRAHPAWSAGAAGRTTGSRTTTLSPALLDGVLHLAEGLTPPGLPRHLVEHRAMEVLLVLVDQGALPLAPPPASASVSDAVRALLRWRPDHPWTADRIGRQIGLSNATVRRRLEREGTSLRVLVQAERMAYAHALLTEEGLSVGEAAQAAGYASRGHFAQQFRRTFGRPPSAPAELQEPHFERIGPTIKRYGSMPGGQER